MKAWFIAGLSILTALTTVQARTIWTLRSDLDELSTRVQTLSKPDEHPAASEHRVESKATPTFARSRTEVVAGALPENKLRELVVGELNKREDDARLAAETHVELALDQARESVARQLKLDDDELATLEDLGDDLKDAEQALVVRKEAGNLSEQALHEEHLRIWNETSADARRLLGDARYAKLEALRRERPELARSIYILRPSPFGRDPRQENAR